MIDHDHDTEELRRIVGAEPVHTGVPDLATLRAGGQRALRRRRAVIGGTALGAATAIVVPTLLLAGGSGDTATDPHGGEVAGPPPSTPSATTIDGLECGVLSCIDPRGPGSGLETGTIVGETLAVGTLPSGAEELVYVVNTEGVDFGTNENGRVDVLKAGYRIGGKLYSTLWSVQPGYDGDSPHRFWYNAGLLDAPEGTADRYVVIGYVDGTPEEITWSTPDGDTGGVDGMQAMDGYTIFYLTRPLPDDYQPPRSTGNKDGSFTIRDRDGKTTKPHPGDSSVLELGAGTFSPELTIHTSDGWSCSLEECGSTG